MWIKAAEEVLDPEAAHFAMEGEDHIPTNDAATDDGLNNVPLMQHWWWLTTLHTYAIGKKNPP